MVNIFRVKKLRQPISTHLSTPLIVWVAPSNSDFGRNQSQTSQIFAVNLIIR